MLSIFVYICGVVVVVQQRALCCRHNTMTDGSDGLVNKCVRLVYIPCEISGIFKNIRELDGSIACPLERLVQVELTQSRLCMRIL